MTEALTKWADEKAGKKWPRPQIDQQADYWVRAFVADVEKLASAENKRLEGRQNYNDLIADAFQRLKSELLGL